MEEKEMHGHGSECEKCTAAGHSCEMNHGAEMFHGVCGGMCGHHGHHRWVRIVIKLLVILFVFCAGMQLGELKGMLRSESGYRGKSTGYGRYNMMRSPHYTAEQTVGTEVATTTVTAK